MLSESTIIIIAVVAVVLFGAPAVVKWAKSAGQARRVYQEELATQKKEVEVTEVKQ
jgi:Sec-independent protein translocase protein TatA